MKNTWKSRISWVTFAGALLLGGYLVVYCGLNRLQGNVPVTFYGRVVDENGHGVPGLTIVAEVDSIPLFRLPVLWNDELAKRKVSVKTATDGTFTLHGGYGTYLNFTELIGPAQIYSDAGNYIYSLPDNDQKMVFHPKPGAPVVIHSYRSRGVQLLTFDDYRFKLPPDGRWHKYRLPVYHDDTPFPTPNHSPDIRFRLTQLAKPDLAGRIVFQLDVEMSSGGFVKAPPQYAFFAPPDGYQPSLSAKIDTDAHRGDVNDRALLEGYYFCIPGGVFQNNHVARIYGIMLFGVDPYREEINVHPILNFSGSRNLEG